ncbi:hypothetical protein M9H77_23300 [Catharanthus roseus]|uniref:Uncharacterized protein n=1 Tax=Catharanthus roseus TaxID=4058 RepID=A0ACC0AVF8_CATRO|nr:hypothetical protein M9H77_23300 [Catharanthus roseus]
MYNMTLLEAIWMTTTTMSTGNEQDSSAHEPCMIIMDKESGLMSNAEIKSSLAFSRLKEKFNAKSNPILKNVSNNTSHLALKKIWIEIRRALEIIEDPKNKYGRYLRTSHGLQCSCELITRLPIQLDNISTFWRTLEINGDHLCSQEKDMDSKMRDLTSLLDQISTRPMSKVRDALSCERDIKSGFARRSWSRFGSSSCGRGRPPRALRGRGRGRSSR